jgi:hypothetical protein
LGAIDFIPVVRSIVPPKRTADEDTRQAWRWAVFYVVLAIGSVLTVHILWACGMLPWVAGFANAADLARLDARAKRIEVRLISAELYDARREQCAALDGIDGGDMEAIRPGALRRLNALMADYEEMTGLTYRIAGCDEF